MYLTIEKKKYKLKFGYGCLRRICEGYGYQKISGFDSLIKKLKLDTMEDPNFEQLDFVGNLVLAAIHNVDDSVDLPIEDVVDVLFCNMDKVTEVFAEFQKSLPRENTTNPESRGK